MRKNRKWICDLINSYRNYPPDALLLTMLIHRIPFLMNVVFEAADKISVFII